MQYASLTLGGRRPLVVKLLCDGDFRTGALLINVSSIISKGPQKPCQGDQLIWPALYQIKSEIVKLSVSFRFKVKIRESQAEIRSYCERRLVNSQTDKLENRMRIKTMTF